jgi:hypothetical protein
LEEALSTHRKAKKSKAAVRAEVDIEDGGGDDDDDDEKDVPLRGNKKRSRKSPFASADDFESLIDTDGDGDAGDNDDDGGGKKRSKAARMAAAWEAGSTRSARREGTRPSPSGKGKGGGAKGKGKGKGRK